MANPTAQECAELSYSLAVGDQTIPYVHGGTTLAGLDCRGYVLYIIRALGGTVRFSGATDLWNNYLQYKDTTAKAKAAGKLIPGALLFHWDGKTAEHVGWYTGIKGKEVAHASQGNGKVVLSPISSYYDHVGWADAVDYVSSGDSGNDGPVLPDAPAEEPGPGQAVVNTESDPLWLRKGPGTSYATDGSLPKGTLVDVLRVQTGEDGKPWALIRWSKRDVPQKERWCAAWLLRMGGDEAAEEPVPIHRLRVVVTGYQSTPLTIEQAINLKDEYRAAGFDVSVEEE